MVNNPIEYVVKQILEKNCTIVLGSGISNNAEGLEVYQNPHRINNMKTNIDELDGKKKTLAELTQNEIWNTKRYLHHLINNRGRFKNFNNATINRYIHNKLISKLFINQFYKLNPTRAHYYIAFLAREGLISDIITTNYDCCMEKAYLKIWKEQYNLEGGNDNLPVVRIFDNATFARYASKKKYNCEDDTYILKVYKINGCAYAITHNEATAESILLTETQLQDWRKRQWAADFFRHKLRTSTLFFIGYGSDEPQVLHTIQKVFEENDNNLADNHVSNVYEMTNAPVVSVYDNISFTHQYIVKQYYLHNGLSIGKSDKLIIDRKNEMVKEQFGKKENLPADSLMELIYKEVLKNLIKKALIYSSNPENASFTAFIPNAEKHLKFISKRDLKPLCEIDGDEIPYPKIIKMLSYMRGEENHYVPVTHNKELVAELIFLLFILYGNFDFRIERMKLEDFSILRTQRNLEVYNFTTKLLEKSNISSVNNNFLVVFLIGKNNFRYNAKRILLQPNGNNGQCLSVYQINLKSIFTYYEGIDLISQDDIKRVIVDAVRKPSKFVANERPSIRRRLRIYE